MQTWDDDEQDEQDEQERTVRRPRGLHHRIYPYMTELVQYANEDLGKDVEPWIVRDRSAALRTERRGRGRAMVRVWTPSEWAYVNPDEDEDETDD